MQWNINDIQSCTSVLLRDLRMGDFSVAMLQETNTHYSRSFTIPKIPGFKSFKDRCGKTAILVREAIPTDEIPINLVSSSTKQEDMTYATAALLHIQRRGRKSLLLLLSIYRSPNGQTHPNCILRYLKQCQTWVKQHHLKLQLKEWIIGGDFNDSHTSWGARRGTARSDRDGLRLQRYLAQDPSITLLNTRTKKPTRVRHDRFRRKTTYKNL